MTAKTISAIAWKSALAVLVAGGAGAAESAAQEPPDYIGLSQKAEHLAVAVTSTKSCVHFGYRDAQDDLALTAQQLADDAELGGMPGGAADMIVAGAIQTEKERQDARTQDMEQRKADPAAVERFLDYWESRCNNLANDPVYGRLFRQR